MEKTYLTYFVLAELLKCKYQKSLRTGSYNQKKIVISWNRNFNCKKTELTFNTICIRKTNISNLC